MKQFILTILLCAPLLATAQNEPVEKLKTLYRDHVAWSKPGTLTYDGQENVVVVNDYKIPVSSNTKVSVDNKGKKVKFYLQQGTTINHVTDASYKRAYFEIPFKTADAAKDFVLYFEQLRD